MTLRQGPPRIQDGPQHDGGQMAIDVCLRDRCIAPYMKAHNPVNRSIPSCKWRIPSRRHLAIKHDALNMR